MKNLAIIMEAWQVVKSDLATLGVHTATKPLLSQSQMNNKLQETVRFSFMDRLKMKTRDASSAAQQASNPTSVQSIKNKQTMSLFHVCQHSKLMSLKPGDAFILLIPRSRGNGDIFQNYLPSGF